MKKTIAELLNDYNELVAQFNNNPDNKSKLRVLKSWKDAKSKLLERIEVLESKVEPAEVDIDELLGAAERKEVPDVNEPAPIEKPKPAVKRTNGIDWTGTSTRQDDVEFKLVKEKSALDRVRLNCNGATNLENIAGVLNTTVKNLKKRIRTIVRRGYRLEITDGKIKLDIPSSQALRDIDQRRD